MVKRKGKDWNPKQYILNEWLATREQWANYNREKEYILTQIGTTGANEGWHNALKTALKLNKNMKWNWSLKGVIQTRKRTLAYLSLPLVQAIRNLFPFPAQVILADNLKPAIYGKSRKVGQ